MVLIEVEEKDKAKTFEILANNGKFTGLENNRFLIVENSEVILKKLKDAGIGFKIINNQK